MYKQITSFICYHGASKYSIFKSYNYEYFVGVWMGMTGNGYKVTFWCHGSIKIQKMYT